MIGVLGSSLKSLKAGEIVKMRAERIKLGKRPGITVAHVKNNNMRYEE